MTDFQLLNGPWSRRLGVLTAVASGFRALARGRTKRGLLLLGAGALSYQWGALGFVAQLAVEGLTRR